MGDNNKSRSEQKEQIRQKIQNDNTEGKDYYVIPAEDKSLIDSNKTKRVCAYCRVSTDDPAQTTSYELQKKHYEKQINETPGWIFAGIYADEGISATSLKNRDEFNRMIADCYAGKIDLIVTKNVSRFARNVVDCLSVVRKLAQLNPPVGVRFENENFYSLDATSELLLTVLAASAQEESKTKSNSMNWSLEKRFDNFNFLTPVLLGYDHDENGNLVINPSEANTIKLIFYSFLAGFSLSEIAQLLNELGRPSKKGNVKWKPPRVREILNNERYCGDVKSWKTYTYDFWEHKKRKNNKNRKQVYQKNHHEGIVSHDVFDAVQVKLDLNKYTRDSRNFPTLNVVDEGMLMGFVSVNRSFKGFTDADYRSASESIYSLKADVHNQNDYNSDICDNRSESESFDFDGYEVARSEFFSLTEKPIMTIQNRQVRFNTICLKKFEEVEYVELLINTVQKCIAIRPCDKDGPNSFKWGMRKDDRWRASPKSISGFAIPLFAITGWDTTDKVKLCGQYLSDGNTQVLLFDFSEPEITRLVQDEAAAKEALADIIIEDNVTEAQMTNTLEQESETVEIVRKETVLPEAWESSFGRNLSDTQIWYYELISYKGDWQILRPAKLFAVAGNVRESVLYEVKRETDRIIDEMRSAV